jgi:hypothetical protein
MVDGVRDTIDGRKASAEPDSARKYAMPVAVINFMF